MFSREFECPSCGAPIKQNKPGSRTLLCTYCGQASHVNADSLEAVGEKQLLIDYGSMFQIGQTGKLGKHEFLVLGRMRLDYEDGFWDEWYIQFLDDGNGAWIQEDDGSFVFFTQEKEFVKAFSIDEIEVGSTHNFWGAWEPVFITSKAKSTVNGGEGELPFRIIPGEPAHFVEGYWDGKIVSVELHPQDHVLFVGTPIDLDDLLLDGHKH